MQCWTVADTGSDKKHVFCLAIHAVYSGGVRALEDKEKEVDEEKEREEERRGRRGQAVIKGWSFMCEIASFVTN